MEVRLLGPVELAGDDGTVVAVPGQKLQLLLAALAVERGKVVSPDRLVEILYGDDPPRQPANSLQVLVSRLRRCLAAGGDGLVIETSDAGYALVTGNGSGTDLERFDEAVARARSNRAHDPAGARDDLAAALALVRGEPLAGLPAEGWARAERARVTEACLAAREDRIDAELAVGSHAGVVGELERLTAEHPLRERLWGQLVLALYRCGRQADALRAYQDARRHLVDELGIEPGSELRRLEAAVLAQDPSLDLPPTPAGRPARPSLVPDGPTTPAGGAGTRRDGHLAVVAAGAASAARPRGNVPRPLTACLGRDRELADVLDLIANHRLVTLVGPGGAGKTRLSIEVAHALTATSPDGVWLVDLAAVRDETGALMAVVRTLGLDEGVLAGTLAPRSADEVALALGDRQMVLLVDNCEHVVDDVARLVETLLARCPDLRVLATSRETLGVPGEFLFVVPPLPLDEAVELFLDRMSAGGAVPPPVDGWRATVAEICARLDGLPLAVELAAARARHLDLAEMVDRLDRRFDLLVDGPRTAQPRQRTLRAVVDWSYDLLDDREARVFERLSVFSGGATATAARAVCAGDDIEPGEVEAALGRLVDKSLVHLDRTPAGARFGMLQTLADYAAGKLAARDDAADVARRHAAWVHELTSTVAITRPDSGDIAHVRRIQVESANVLQAVAWALEHDPLLGLALAGNLGWHWFTTMQAGLAWSVLTTALDRADGAPDELVARARSLAGLAGVMAGRPAEGFAHADAALPLEERIGDPQRLGWAHFLRASQHVFSTEAQAARAWLDTAGRFFAEAGDEHGRSAVAYQRGVVAGLLGDLDEAHRLLTEAAAACRRAGNHMTLMASLARLGEVAERDGRPADSYAAWEELRDLATEAAVPALVTLAAAGMALVRVDAGDAQAAVELGEAALAASREGFSPVIGGYALAAWGAAQAAFGDRRLGVERVHEAAGLFSRIGYHGGAAECWWRLSQISADQGDCGDAVQCAEQAVACAEQGDDLFARQAARAQLDAARRLAG
ncbi:MAG TPA: BTAD domain-containing putative transcriptional regulator [Acidimicrobiales bacterium]|nr:BTAD domain-containing putative transcriptional regulator [Acidimicrobiales bacterium]